VASAIRVPFYSDLNTLSHKRLNYARVCVEINASEMVVKDYDLHCPNRTLINISTNYKWLPSKCSSYINIFGHTRIICPKIKLINFQWWKILRGKMMLLELSLQITSKICFNGRKSIK
jgi:hypothetical protein